MADDDGPPLAQAAADQALVARLAPVLQAEAQEGVPADGGGGGRAMRIERKNERGLALMIALFFLLAEVLLIRFLK